MLGHPVHSYNGIVGDSCFPEILDNNNEGEEVVEIKNGKHPLLASGDFIPNDVMLSQKVFILTGRTNSRSLCKITMPFYCLLKFHT